MCYLKLLSVFIDILMKKILIIVVLLLYCSCSPTITEDGNWAACDNTILLNDSPMFQEYLNRLEFDTSVDDYYTKRRKILLAMSDIFWHNTFAKDNIGLDNPGVVGVSYEKRYGGFELYSIYQSNAWIANHGESITSIEHKQGYHIAYSMNDEPILPISERLDSEYSLPFICINEVSYYLAIRDNPFQYYAIANVIEGGQPAISIIDSISK